ncbi:MAG TPA: transposase [Ktedonobacterales bacterium]|nr:transposase [Ktedonobacterales bacterium]
MSPLPSPAHVSRRRCPPSGQAVGLDVGLKVFAMPTTGEPEENPRFFRSEERALARAQRKHRVALDAHKTLRAALMAQVQAQRPALDARQVWQQVSQDAGEHTAWRERQRWCRVVARVRERIRRRRSDFTHQESHCLVDAYDVFAVEDLAVRNIVRNHALAKSIHGAAWIQVAALLRSKAAWAGRARIAVDPAHTSQDCSQSWLAQPRPDAGRPYVHCLNPARPGCRLIMDRDRNAASNILARGRELVTAVG